MFLNEQRHSICTLPPHRRGPYPAPCPMCNVIFSLCSLPVQCIRPRSLAGWRGLWMERQASYPRTTWSSCKREPWQNCWAFHGIHDNCWFQCCGPLLFAAEKYRVTDSAATCQHERFRKLWCHTSPWSSQLTCVILQEREGNQQRRPFDFDHHEKGLQSHVSYLAPYMGCAHFVFTVIQTPTFWKRK